MHGRLRRWSRWHWRIGSYGSHGYGVHHAFVLGLLLLVALVDAASDATTYGDATDTDENDEPNGSAIASVAVADQLLQLEFTRSVKSSHSSRNLCAVAFVPHNALGMADA